jgi:NAD(P)-dependent dehydrogenase (short-subunit alcohol dehydrogenase family)
LAIAEALAGAGAKIVLNGRSPTRLGEAAEKLAATGAITQTLVADVSDAAEAKRVAEAARAAFGRIDILVNCAGSNIRKPILEFTPEEYDKIMAVHARATFFVSQNIAPMMIAQGGGKIINIGSATIRTGLADVSVYGMAKASMDALTRTMAVEWAEHNIQVNCLAPGFIMTDMTKTGLWANERRNAWLMDRIPMRRPGLPEDMAGTALLLASPASDYLTGQTIHVDGGFAAGSKW